MDTLNSALIGQKVIVRTYSAGVHISEADAEAEGVQIPALVPILGAFWSSRDGYARLWEHINGTDSWAANPWVWAVTFEVQARP